MIQVSSPSTAAEILANAAAVRKRIAYPPKRPIVMPARPAQNLRKPISVAGNANGRPRKYTFDRVLIFSMFQKGSTLTAISDATDIPLKQVSKFIKKMGWTR